MKYRKFKNEFKKQVVEQLLSGTTKVCELCRQHDLSRTVIYRWQREYASGQLDNQPTNAQLAAEIKIKELEGLVGRLLMENEILKKAVKLASCPLKPNAISSEKTKVYSGALSGGVEC